MGAFVETLKTVNDIYTYTRPPPQKGGSALSTYFQRPRVPAVPDHPECSGMTDTVDPEPRANVLQIRERGRCSGSRCQR